MSDYLFDATTVDPSSPPNSVWEKGRYLVLIRSAEEKDTSAKTGKRVLFTFEALNGPEKGSKIQIGINRLNDSARAQEIGQRQLSQLCYAVGVLRPRNWHEFDGRQLMLDVDVEEKPSFKDGKPQLDSAGNQKIFKDNWVREYLKADGSPVVAGQAAAPAASAPPAFVTQAAPAPAPAPVPAPAPAPAPVPDGKLYHVAHKGTDLTKGTPVNAAAVSAFGHPLAELHVCENAPGAQWVSGSTLQPAPVTTAPAGAPPWVK